MDEDVVQGVIETIDSAKEHQHQLSILLDSLSDAKVQINESAEQSIQELESHFTALRVAINDALDERLKELSSQVTEIQQFAVDPLNECEQMIQKQIEAAAGLLKEGLVLISGDHESSQVAMKEYKAKANTLSLNSLPDVPSLSEVACISVDLPKAAEEQLTVDIGDYGQVMSRSPVQITELESRPGAILVRWAEVEEESCLDLTEFRLQSCSGTSSEFADIYTGSGTSFTLRHVKSLVPYTFRVCGRAEGAFTWSPWSVKGTCFTTLPHYEWMGHVPGYVTSNENKIAHYKGTTNDASHQILFSNGSQYTCGHSIVFKILESGEINDQDGIGLTQTKGQNFMNKGSLFVTAQGKVYMDGQEKTTKLPALSRSSVLTFETEVLRAGKVRVNVETNEKVVTFDWPIEPVTNSTAPLSAVGFDLGAAGEKEASRVNLYFGLVFSASNWKVGVE